MELYQPPRASSITDAGRLRRPENAPLCDNSWVWSRIIVTERSHCGDAAQPNNTFKLLQKVEKVEKER